MKKARKIIVYIYGIGVLLGGIFFLPCEVTYSVGNVLAGIAFKPLWDVSKEFPLADNQFYATYRFDSSLGFYLFLIFTAFMVSMFFVADNKKN